MQQVRDVEHLGHLGDARGDLGRGSPTELHRESDVLEDGHVRVEGVVLEDHRHPPFVGRHPGDVPIAEEDRPGIRLVEAGDQVQGRALSAAGRAEERHEGAVRDLEAEIVDRADLAVVTGQVAQAERGDGHETSGNSRKPPRRCRRLSTIYRAGARSVKASARGYCRWVAESLSSRRPTWIVDSIPRGDRATEPGAIAYRWNPVVNLF